jgi:hypothetical protein
MRSTRLSPTNSCAFAVLLPVPSALTFIAADIPDVLTLLDSTFVQPATEQTAAVMTKATWRMAWPPSGFKELPRVEEQGARRAERPSSRVSESHARTRVHTIRDRAAALLLAGLAARAIGDRYLGVIRSAANGSTSRRGSPSVSVTRSSRAKQTPERAGGRREGVSSRRGVGRLVVDSGRGNATRSVWVVASSSEKVGWLSVINARPTRASVAPSVQRASPRQIAQL